MHFGLSCFGVHFWGRFKAKTNNFGGVPHLFLDSHLGETKRNRLEELALLEKLPVCVFVWLRILGVGLKASQKETGALDLVVILCHRIFAEGLWGHSRSPGVHLVLQT